MASGEAMRSLIGSSGSGGDHLLHRWTSVLKAIERKAMHVISFSLYPRSHVPLQAVGHQCGTCCFGSDPNTSVLDLNCRAHDIDNLYVVDGSFFPSNSGVNPTLPLWQTRSESVIIWLND